MTTTSGVAVIDRARWVLPVAADPICDGAVVSIDGLVQAVGRFDDVVRALDAPQLREWSGVLTPGLVNAHSHLQFTCMAQVGQHQYGGFEEWSQAFGAVYTQPHDWAGSTRAGLALALESGTTAIADIVTDPQARWLQHEAGVHGVSYWEVMGWLHQTWVSRGRAETLHLVASDKHPPLGLSPHAPYSVDTQVIRDLGDMAAELGVRRHMHLAESAWELAYVEQGSGPLAERWRGWGYAGFEVLRGGGTRQRPVAYADAIGALGPQMHVAHGIYVDADDRARLRRTGTVVALCPRSNAVIGLAEAPVAAYLAEGNPIAVGTDSLSSSPSLDVLADVAALARLARSQGYTGDDLDARLLHAATAGGAQAMGLHEGEGRLGVLAEGSLADMTVLDVDGGTAAEVLATVVADGAGTAVGTIISGEVRWSASMRSDATSTVA